MDLECSPSPFPPTRWTLVLQAYADGNQAAASQALTRLCSDYWYPLYAYARRFGHGPHDAEDLTQGFFAYALERNLFASANQQLGRLRTFLLTAFSRFMAGVHDREQTLKRGGEREHLVVDVLVGEERYAAELAEQTTPESVFEQSWALTVLDSALHRLGKDEAAAGRAAQFRAVESFLSPTTVGEVNCAQVAAALGQTEQAVWQIISRLRAKFRVVLQRQIADTLLEPTPARIEDEIAALRAALRGELLR